MNDDDPVISKTDVNLLEVLQSIGGGATVDALGAVRHGSRILPGAAGEWVRLVVRGAVAGEHGKLVLTQHGREILAERGL